MGARHTAQGFTLIEVLVAFMILTLSLSVLFRIFSGGLNNVAVAGNYAQAVLVAESQLALVGHDEPLLVGQSYGEAGERFRWRRTIENYVPWEDDTALTLPVSTPGFPAYRRRRSSTRCSGPNRRPGVRRTVFSPCSP